MDQKYENLFIENKVVRWSLRIKYDELCLLLGAQIKSNEYLAMVIQRGHWSKHNKNKLRAETIFQIKLIHWKMCCHTIIVYHALRILFNALQQLSRNIYKSLLRVNSSINEWTVLFSCQQNMQQSKKRQKRVLHIIACRTIK